MARYVGQCDRVRRGNADNEAKWQAMMSCAERISFDELVASVDLSSILDEGETAEAFIAAASLSDPSTAAYRSWWGTERCWFHAYPVDTPHNC